MTTTITEADCGCRFKMVTALPRYDSGTFVLEAPCTKHSFERTKWIEERMDCGCEKGHRHSQRSGFCLAQDCDQCRPGDTRSLGFGKMGNVV